MRIPRFRMTLRWMMVAVVLAALGLAASTTVTRREADFRRLAAYHLQSHDLLIHEAGGIYECNSFQRDDETLEQAEDRMYKGRGPREYAAYRASVYHYDLYRRYVEAAAFPYWPVPADPTPPPGANPRVSPDPDIDRVIREMIAFERNPPDSI